MPRILRRSMRGISGAFRLLGFSCDAAKHPEPPGSSCFTRLGCTEATCSRRFSWQGALPAPGWPSATCGAPEAHAAREIAAAVPATRPAAFAAAESHRPVQLDGISKQAPSADGCKRPQDSHQPNLDLGHHGHLVSRVRRGWRHSLQGRRRWHHIRRLQVRIHGDSQKILKELLRFPQP